MGGASGPLAAESVGQAPAGVVRDGRREFRPSAPRRAGTARKAAPLPDGGPAAPRPLGAKSR